MINKADYIDLGLACADAYGVLDRGMKERRVDQLSPSGFETIVIWRVDLTRILHMFNVRWIIYFCSGVTDRSLLDRTRNKYPSGCC